MCFYSALGMSLQRVIGMPGVGDADSPRGSRGCLLLYSARHRHEVKEAFA